MLNLCIVQTGPKKENAILSGPHRADDELFERVLRELSTGAFRVVVNSGVRDIDAFLELDATTLSDVSSKIKAELSSAQQRIRQHLRGCFMERSVDHSDESERESNADDTWPTATDDYHLFQAVLDCLGVRAQHALAYGRVRNLQQFMHLEKDVMARWPNTGAKTIAEIMDVQRQVNELGSSLAYRETLNADSLRNRLGQFPARLSRRVERRMSTNRRVFSRAVEHNVDKPADWSVLRKTIPDLFPLDERELDALWVSAGERSIGSTVELSEDDWQKLNAAVIYKDDSFDVLLVVTLGYLLELQISSEAFEAIIDSVASLINSGEHPAQRRLLCPGNDEPIVTHADIAAIRSFRIDSFNLPGDCIDSLYAQGVHAWSDLVNLTERTILESSGLSLEALRRIRDVWRTRLHARLAVQELLRLPIESYSSFQSMAECFIESVAKDDRYKTIALGRLGFIDGRKITFEELSEFLGLTRARVQQIWQKRASKLKSPVTLNKLARFWVAVFETLKVSGGACLLSELAEGIRERLGWTQAPELVALSSLLRLRNDIEFDSHQSIVHDPKVECLGCRDVADVMARLFDTDKDEKSIDEVAKMKLLAKIALKPLRLAFDHIELKDDYIDRVKLAVDYGVTHLSNYVLYNYKDTPQDFYERLRINAELNQKLGVQIYSFPMKYIPLDAKDRTYVGRHWNRRLLRGVQCILLATKGKVGTHLDFFEAAFGRTPEEFIEIAMMPEHYIIHRRRYENNGAREWREAFRALSESEKMEFMNVASETRDSSRRQRFEQLLSHYCTDQGRS